MLPQQMPVEITAYRLSGTQPCQNRTKSFLTGKSKYFNCFRTYKHDEAHRLVFRSHTKAVCVVHTPAFANLQYQEGEATHPFATGRGFCCDRRCSSGLMHWGSTVWRACHPLQDIQRPCLAYRSHTHAAYGFHAALVDRKWQKLKISLFSCFKSIGMHQLAQAGKEAVLAPVQQFFIALQAF